MRRRDLLKLAPALLLPAAVLASQREVPLGAYRVDASSGWVTGCDVNAEGEAGVVVIRSDREGLVENLGIVVSESEAHAEWAKDVGRPPQTEAEKRAAFCSHALRLANAAASA